MSHRRAGPHPSPAVRQRCKPDVQTMAGDLPLFLLFLPPKLGGGRVRAGATVPPSANPLGDGDAFPPRGGHWRRLEHRWAAEHRRGRGDGGAFHREGRRDHFGQKQPTILVHQSLTKAGGEKKSSSWVFASRVVGRSPWQGSVSHQGRGAGQWGAGGTRRQQQVVAPRKPFCFLEVPLKNRLTPKVTLERWELSLGLRPGGWEGFAPRWGGGRGP